MSRPSPSRPSRARRWLRDDAITPVVGTSMILVITVLGMAAVLFWGTPTLQGIQDRGSVVGMEGEFDELRRASLELSIPDASRVPSVVLEDGTLNLEDGTRMGISVSYDPSAAYAPCDLAVTGWETPGNDILTISASGCRISGSIVGECATGACFAVYSVGGSTPQLQTSVTFTGAYPTYTADGNGLDFGEGDWLVRLTDSSSGDTVAASWVLDQKRITWRLSTSVSDFQLHMEGGAIFEAESGSFFLQRPPPIREDAFGSDDYVLRLVTLLGSVTDSSRGAAGRGTPEVYLGLLGNHVRESTSDATQIRYSWSGELAEAWCQTMLIRDTTLDKTANPTPSYLLASGSSCSDAVPSVIYTTKSGTDNQPFPFEFIHARIASSIRA